MRLMITLIGAGLLAGCGQTAGGGNAAANGAAPDASAPASGGGGSGSSASALAQMQPGEWEISMALPNGTQMPGTHICLTPEDVARGVGAMLSGGGRQQQGINCDYSGVNISGGRIDGTSSCTTASGMTVSVTMNGTMTPTEYDVNQSIRTTTGGQTRETQAHITGRRVGECQAGQR